MRRAAVRAVLVVAVVAGPGRAQDPYRYFYVPAAAYQPPAALPAAQPEAPPPRPVQPKGPPDATPPTAPQPNPLADRLADPFAQRVEAGGEAARGFNENFYGDLGGVTYARTLTVGTARVPRVVGTQEVVTVDPRGNKVVTLVPIVVTDTVPVTRVVRVPVGTRYAGVLVSENDSPLPGNRIYGGYNYYDRLNASLNPGLGPVNMSREMVGFETAVLDGDASVGMRVPFVQQYGPAGTGLQAVGDLTVQSKFALVRDLQSADVWSAGLYVTAPTGGGRVALADGGTVPRSWLFQPWTGFVRTFEWGYVQGVSGMIVPSDGRDPLLVNNSLAVGWAAYRGPADGLLAAVVPVAEVHVHTPLNKRDPNGVVYFQDQVNVTAGVHFRTARVTFSPGVNVPVVGPRPWNLEAIGFFNYRY